MNQFQAVYQSVMHHEHNPLKHLSVVTQFRLMMILSWMWSMVFSLSFLSIFYFQWVWLAHVLLASATLSTIWLFKHVQSRTEPDSKEASRCVWQLDNEA